MDVKYAWGYNFQRKFVTGTETEPDNLTFFIKRENGSLKAKHSESYMNLIGKTLPIAGSITGAMRAVSAINTIIKNFKDRNSISLEPQECSYWNAFKNLCRGIVEMIPCSGVFLLIYDAIRYRIILNENIMTYPENDIVGVAIDDRVIWTEDLSKFKNSSDDEIFGGLKNRLESNRNRRAKITDIFKPKVFQFQQET